MANELNLLYYNIIKEEYIFYYGKEILFKNSKNNPFLYVSIEKEGVKKDIPLHYCDIEKNGSIGYKLKFYNNACTVICNLNCKGSKVFFNLTKKGLYGEKLNINLNKKNSKITGLGLNNKKDISKIKEVSYIKNNNKLKALDTRLDFSVKNGYFFSNYDIDDWEISFKSVITVTTRQNEANFCLEFNKKFIMEDKVNEVLRLTEAKNIEKYLNDERIKGFITDFSNDIRFINNLYYLRNKGYKYYLRLSPVINEKNKNAYDKKGLLYIGNENYLIDINNENNCRIFANKIRELLDMNIDGFYIDEIGINITKSIHLQNALIYKNFHKLIHRISKEYPRKNHIYNKFNSYNNINNIYSLNYNDIKNNESFYLRALLYSNCESVFYECTENKLNKLLERGKKQIIVKNNKTFIF